MIISWSASSHSVKENLPNCIKVPDIWILVFCTCCKFARTDRWMRWWGRHCLPTYWAYGQLVLIIPDGGHLGHVKKHGSTGSLRKCFLISFQTFSSDPQSDWTLASDHIVVMKIVSFFSLLFVLLAAASTTSQPHGLYPGLPDGKLIWFLVFFEHFYFFTFLYFLIFNVFNFFFFGFFAFYNFYWDWVCRYLGHGIVIKIVIKN